MSKRNKRHQQQQWQAAQTPQQHYAIHPRYLAGGGDLRHITEYLRVSGWANSSPKQSNVLVFDNPERTLRVAYDPLGTPPGWAVAGLNAAGGQMLWQARLSPQTPVEIVAGLTDALTQQQRPAHAPNVWAPLEQHGWEAASETHPTAISPDKNAWMQWRQNGPGDAYWWAGAQTEHGATWDAAFSSSTPMHLIQAFTTQLASPEPVMRPLGHVPPTSRIRAQSLSVLPADLSAWQQRRLNAARAATAWARGAWGVATEGRNRSRSNPQTTAGTRSR